MRPAVTERTLAASSLNDCRGAAASAWRRISRCSASAERPCSAARSLSRATSSRSRLRKINCAMKPHDCNDIAAIYARSEPLSTAGCRASPSGHQNRSVSVAERTAARRSQLKGRSTASKPRDRSSSGGPAPVSENFTLRFAKKVRRSLLEGDHAPRRCRNSLHPGGAQNRANASCSSRRAPDRCRNFLHSRNRISANPLLQKRSH